MVNMSSAKLPMLALFATIAMTVSAHEVGKPADSVVTLTSDNFKDALNDPVNPLWFLKFYAPWCGEYL